ncbi:Acyl-CoA dehydrogenase/oxidase C-terminal [Syntrophomonas zehnderi OL-4]|uniref:Acyl-CoA dehydrogenase/oxidase C-terminal n=1 Tax=Syntrophomonas zehnderi OL-4 TaxID=690567 RepID=A0A0E4C9B1_9FIRM|nr:acyl-CoA dehydrogenase [Syntrophomonas zehnderi]CFX91933.1 Acyl-CoA dehydrogenase/oxidase C-terminal [Syntrophomonas zehnderi OL-4]
MSAGNFIFDTRDTRFILKEWLDMDKLLGYPAYRDYYTKDDVDSFVDVVYKICRDVVAPANAECDEIGVKFVDGKVITPDGLKKAYDTVIEAGLGPQFADREAEGRLPWCFGSCLTEMIINASAATSAYWGLTMGAAGVIQTYAAPELKERFLPKMFNGQWGGTMGITEAGAGSDVGAAITKAYPTDKPGLYKIKGGKMFITSGDHDMVENFVHLVLARIEGAREGTGGLSLFIVPKIWVNEDGSLGDSNDVTTVGIEHKMGLKGSATCTLALGEDNNCYGYLIGDPPDEKGKGQGMAQMFQMMNEERLGTGVLALGTASAAYQQSLAYSKERVQSSKLTDMKGPAVRIIEHEDVRRMLMFQKSITEACRAMIMKTYFYIDTMHDSPDEAEREFAYAMFHMSNPLCKAYTSDMAWPSIAEAIQVYGGYGYIEEYPCAQYARDVKIFSIWEGTNYIQALDLCARKMTMNKGKVMMTFMKEIGTFIEMNKATPGFEDQFKVLGGAFAEYQAILGLFNGYMQAGKVQMLGLFATRILHATAMVYCGRLLLDQALLAARQLQAVGEDHFDATYYKGKMASAKFYIMNIVPEVFNIKRVFELGDTTAADLPEDCLR